MKPLTIPARAARLVWRDKRTREIVADSLGNTYRPKRPPTAAELRQAADALLAMPFDDQHAMIEAAGRLLVRADAAERRSPNRAIERQADALIASMGK